MSSNTDYQQFHALSLGKCIVTDPMAKTAVKMATRNIVRRMLDNQNYRRRNRYLRSKFGIDSTSSSSTEVIIEIYSNRLLIRNRPSLLIEDSSNDSVIEWQQKHISSCFVLREDKRIVSIVAFNPEMIQMEANVFILADKQIVRHLMEILYKMLIKNTPLINNNNADDDANTSGDSLIDDKDDDDDQPQKHHHHYHQQQTSNDNNLQQLIHL